MSSGNTASGPDHDRCLLCSDAATPSFQRRDDHTGAGVLGRDAQLEDICPSILLAVPDIAIGRPF